MKRVCAWCGRKLGGGDGEPAQLVSHGICPQCAEAFENPEGELPQGFFDSLDEPVLLLDAQSVVLGANAAARELLGRDLPRLTGLPGGDVLECAWARLPGGCGKTVHCQACAIRRTVAETARTGEGRQRVEAWVGSSSGHGRRTVVISTERVGACVLLRLDQLDEAG